MNNKSTKWTNPLVLRKLREKLNLTPEQVEKISKKLKKQHFEPISSSQLSQWEAGRNEPELVHLETLSEIYHCPVGYFLIDKMPKEKIPISYRGLSDDKKLSYISQSSLHRFYELANFTVDLIEKLNLVWKPKIRPGEISPNYKILDNIIKQKRSDFNWEGARKEIKNFKEAFRWWREKIESLGIFCFELKLEPNEVRGASLWLKSYPFILVNHQNVESSAGRIFTLLHEYVHLLSAEEGILCDFRGIKSGQNPEPFANKFAAGLLLTDKELKQHLNSLGLFEFRQQWSDKDIDKIRKPFFVSRDVIVIMLQEMELAPNNLYENKITEWEKRKIVGRGGKKPSRKEQLIRELGYSFTKLFATPFNETSFPILDASYLFNLKIEKTNEFIKWLREKI